MIINHNISALNTYRQLTLNNNNASKSIEKLSSGYRINRAGDDAAGLAISEKMRAQIRGLDMAQKNAQDGISLIQTAEGALNEVHSILQRMRELAVQAANDTNTDDDRAELQKEIEQLKSEIDRISTDTEFNTKKLLDGSIGIKADKDATNAAAIKDVKVVNDNLSGTFKISASDITVNKTVTSGGGTNVNSVDIVAGKTVAVGTYTIKVESTGTQNVFNLTMVDPNGTETIVNGQSIDTSADKVDVTVGDLTLTWNKDTIAGEGTIKVNISVNAKFTLKDNNDKEIKTVAVSGNDKGAVSIGGFEIGFDSGLQANTTTISVTTNALSFQIGANENQYTKLAVSNMSSEALGVDEIDLTSTDSASNAITTIDKAIQSVSSERAKLGAIQNRLEHTINNLGTSAENLTAAESRIRDVDMAKEMMEFTKNNILQQAAQAMLAQANQLPQNVLQLLR